MLCSRVLIFIFLAVLSEAKHQLVWSLSTNAAVWGPPCLDADHNIFVSSSDGALYKFKAGTNEKLWRVQASKSLRGAPVCLDHGNMVITSTMESCVVSLSMGDGKEIWRWKNPVASNVFWISRDPSDKNIIYVGLRENACVKIDVMSGKELQRFVVGAGVWGNPLVLDAEVIVGVTAGTAVSSFPKNSEGKILLEKDALWTYDIMPGVTNWKPRVGAWIFSSPTLVSSKDCGGDLVVFGSNDGRIRAVSRKDGALMWKTPQFGKITTTVLSTATDGKPILVFASESSVVGCLSACDGKVVWQQSFQPTADAAVALEQDVKGNMLVVFVEKSGFIHWLHSNGSTAERTQISCVPKSPPSIDADGNVVIGCASGTVYALHDDLKQATLRTAAPLQDSEAPTKKIQDSNESDQPVPPSRFDTEAPDHFAAPDQSSVMLIVLICCVLLVVLRRVSAK